MCVDTTMMDQAVAWVAESTWTMMFDMADKFDDYHFFNLLADVIHLDNVNRGLVGYKPELNFNFAIGL